MPEFGKRKRTECIEPDDDRTQGNIFRMTGNPDKICNGFPEKYRTPNYCQGGKKQGSTKSIKNIRLIFRPLHEPEISCFKGKYDQGKQKGDKGKDQAHFAILNGTAEFSRKVGGEQIVQKACEDGTCSVPDGLGC